MDALGVGEIVVQRIRLLSNVPVPEPPAFLAVRVGMEFVIGAIGDVIDLVGPVGGQINRVILDQFQPRNRVTMRSTNAIHALIPHSPHVQAWGPRRDPWDNDPVIVVWVNAARRDRQLPGVTDTEHKPRHALRAAHCGQKNRYEDGDNGDDYKQFNQREAL